MKVVLANGCWDPLHWGHLQHLKQAKAMGDRLVVSVTRNGYVNKGPGRPVFDQKQRVEMVRALRIVDQVILSVNALDALKKVKPDIFVKGKEYTDGISLNDRRYCEQHNIKIRFTKGRAYSSTDLVRNYGFRPR